MFKNKSIKFFLSFIIVIIIFAFDRFSKFYILNLVEAEKYIDIYFNSFLNFHLIWNTGIGFGLFSSSSNIYYHLITFFIVLINIIILVMILKLNNYKIFFLSMILGGSLGNLFDRIYYYAVPDFIDLHYNNFHWFIFNVADIFITLGVICLIFIEIFFIQKTNNENK